MRLATDSVRRSRLAAMLLVVPSAALAGEAETVATIRAGTAELSCVVPYRIGRVPVVFVHGMLGSPENWSAMIEPFSEDPAVRDRFQPLVFRYDSLQPIEDSGRHLVEALREARRRFDPEGRDAGFDRMILVGFSMGGLVAKAAIRGLDPGLPGREVPTRAEAETPSRPRIGRFIFVATPHRGSPVDRGAVWFAGSRVARVLSPSAPAWGARVSSIDQIGPGTPLLAELERARSEGGVPFHSIIATLQDPSAVDATDGLVPVSSARLPGARSELVLRTHHLCLRNPEVIGEVRRILIEDANAPLRPQPGGAAVSER